MQIRIALACTAAAVLVAGCQSAPEPRRHHSVSLDPEVSTLENAELKTRMSCVGKRPLKAGEKFSELPLVCQGFSETVTLGQIQDAGWRLESASIEKTKSGDREIPVSIVVRKLF